MKLQTEKKEEGIYRKLVLIMTLSFLTSACSVNSDPDKAGFLGSMYHLSKGTYKQNNEKHQQALISLREQQQREEKRLQVLNKQLHKKQLELSIAKKSLSQIIALQQQKQRQLDKTSDLSASNKLQLSRLQKKIIKLDQTIKKEKIKASKQAASIDSLELKRDKLRKELIMQSADPL